METYFGTSEKIFSNDVTFRDASSVGFEVVGYFVRIDHQSRAFSYRSFGKPSAIPEGTMVRYVQGLLDIAPDWTLRNTLEQARFWVGRSIVCHDTLPSEYASFKEATRTQNYSYFEKLYNQKRLPASYAQGMSATELPIYAPRPFDPRTLTKSAMGDAFLHDSSGRMYLRVQGLLPEGIGLPASIPSSLMRFRPRFWYRFRLQLTTEERSLRKIFGISAWKWEMPWTYGDFCLLLYACQSTFLSWMSPEARQLFQKIYACLPEDSSFCKPPKPSDPTPSSSSSSSSAKNSSKPKSSSKGQDVKRPECTPLWEPYGSDKKASAAEHEWTPGWVKQQLKTFQSDLVECIHSSTSFFEELTNDPMLTEKQCRQNEKKGEQLCRTLSSFFGLWMSDTYQSPLVSGIKRIVSQPRFCNWDWAWRHLYGNHPFLLLDDHTRFAWSHTTQQLHQSWWWSIPTVVAYLTEQSLPWTRAWLETDSFTMACLASSNDLVPSSSSSSSSSFANDACANNVVCQDHPPSCSSEEDGDEEDEYENKYTSSIRPRPQSRTRRSSSSSSSSRTEKTTNTLPRLHPLFRLPRPVLHPTPWSQWARTLRTSFETNHGSSEKNRTIPLQAATRLSFQPGTFVLPVSSSLGSSFRWEGIHSVCVRALMQLQDTCSYTYRVSSNSVEQGMHQRLQELQLVAPNHDDVSSLQFHTIRCRAWWKSAQLVWFCWKAAHNNLEEEEKEEEHPQEEEEEEEEAFESKSNVLSASMTLEPKERTKKRKSSVSHSQPRAAKRNAAIRIVHGGDDGAHIECSTHIRFSGNVFWTPWNVRHRVNFLYSLARVFPERLVSLPRPVHNALAQAESMWLRTAFPGVREDPKDAQEEKLPVDNHSLFCREASMLYTQSIWMKQFKQQVPDLLVLTETWEDAHTWNQKWFEGETTWETLALNEPILLFPSPVSDHDRHQSSSSSSLQPPRLMRWKGLQDTKHALVQVWGDDDDNEDHLECHPVSFLRPARALPIGALDVSIWKRPRCIPQLAFLPSSHPSTHIQCVEFWLSLLFLVRDTFVCLGSYAQLETWTNVSSPLCSNCFEFHFASWSHA